MDYSNFRLLLYPSTTNFIVQNFSILPALRGLQPRRLYLSICNANILKALYVVVFNGLQILRFVLRDYKSRRAED
jgi:hypothetical protein